MGLLLVVVLTCAGNLDRGACNRETALDVRIAGRTRMPTECALRGMMVAARDSDLSDGRYCLVRCERS